MQQTTSAMTEIANTSLSQSTMQAHIQMLQSMSLNMLTHTNPSNSVPLVAYSSTRANCSSMIADFVHFLTAIVPQLERMGSRLSSPVRSSIGTSEERLFWELWRLLANLSQAFHMVSGMLECPQPFNPPLLSAFYKLLQWLLPMTRSSAWMKMRSRHGSNRRNCDLVTILGTISESLLSLNDFQPNVVASNLGSLPVKSLPMICSIVSEQFGNAPLLLSPATPLAHSAASVYSTGLWMQKPSDSYMRTILFESLTRVIFRLVKADKGCDHHGHFSCLMNPAVLQCCKTILLIVPYGSPKIDKQYMRYSVECMQELLLFALEDAQPWLVGPLSALDRPSEFHLGQACLPAHAIPCVSRQAMHTDMRVLHVLGSYVGADKLSATMCYQVQTLILRSWSDSMERCSLDQELTSEMAGAVAGLGKQCMSHSLQFLRAQSQPNVQKNIPATAKALPGQQHDQLSSSSHASSQVAPFLGLGLDCMPTVSRLVFTTSSFLPIAKQNDTPLGNGEKPIS